MTGVSRPLPDGLASLWYEYWRRFSGTRAERKALALGDPADVASAQQWVSDRMLEGGLAAIQVLVALTESAPEGDTGKRVGIGPVEDLIYTHGDDIVEPLVDAARRTPALARALAWVSLAEGSVSADSLTRLERYRTE